MTWKWSFLVHGKIYESNKHPDLRRMFLSLLPNLAFHVFVNGPNDLVVFAFPPGTEHTDKWTGQSRTQACHHVDAEDSSEEDRTFAVLVPDCPSLGCSPVTGTPHGSGCLPEHWAALVCLSGVRAREKQTPADWKQKHTHTEKKNKNCFTLYSTCLDVSLFY